jgi:hypothetical protein
MSFLRQLLPGMAWTNAAQSEINFDTDMVDVEEGQSNRAVVEYSNEEGQSNRAVVEYSNEEGQSNRAMVKYANEEGQNNRAMVIYANEEGQNNRAMVIYDRRAKVPDSTIAVRRNTTRKNPPERMLPHTPSKRQYREVDDSISLQEQTRTLMAENGRLVEQHNILMQQTEEAAQLLRQAQMKHEEESKNMQLAQQKFEQAMTERY